MTEYELFKALRPLYPAAEYALLPQVANGTGSRANRHADALALSLWPSRGLHLSGFEIKSYRGDWLRELANPEKAEPVARFCNFWWIVAAGPFVQPDDELPPGWGLLVWDKGAGVLKKVKAAPYREAEKPDVAFIAGILRKSQEVVTPDAVIEEAKRQAFEMGKAEGLAGGDRELRDLRALKKKVSDFEKTSGVSIEKRWECGSEIGEAVSQVINGTVMREAERLRETAAHILRELGPPTEKPMARTVAGRRRR